MGHLPGRPADASSFEQSFVALHHRPLLSLLIPGDVRVIPVHRHKGVRALSCPVLPGRPADSSLNRLPVIIVRLRPLPPSDPATARPGASPPDTLTIQGLFTDREFVGVEELMTAEWPKRATIRGRGILAVACRPGALDFATGGRLDAGNNRTATLSPYLP